MAAAIAFVMIVVYIGLIRRQGGQVAAWFVAGLAVAATLCLYGVAREVPSRRWALAVSGVMLTLLGFVSILSIGFPVLLAGFLALAAAARGRFPRT